MTNRQNQSLFLKQAHELSFRLQFKFDNNAKVIEKKKEAYENENPDWYDFTHEFKKNRLQFKRANIDFAIKNTKMYQEKLKIKDIAFYKMLIEFILKSKLSDSDIKQEVIKKIQNDFGVKEFLPEIVNRKKCLDIAPMYGAIYNDSISDCASNIIAYFKMCNEGGRQEGEGNQCPNILFYGPPGTVKSEMMGGVVNRLAQNGCEIYFFTIRLSDFPTIEYFKVVVKIDELDCFASVDRNKGNENNQGREILGEMLPILEDFSNMKRSLVLSLLLIILTVLIQQ